MAIKNKSRTNSPPSATSAAAARAAALSAMLACNACPAQAFQSTFLAPIPRTMYHAAALSSPLVPATTMRIFSSPWDPECSRMQQRLRRGGIQRRRRLDPMIFAPPSVFQDDSQLEIRDPAVAETGDSYRLTFDLPAEVEEDGVDVSVSDRLLTIKARVTQEDLGGHRARRRGGGWATSSSRTDSVSRSFVLPEGVSADGVEASWVSDGKVEVKFSKDPTKAKAADGAAAAAAAAATGDSPAAASTVSQAVSSTGSTAHTGEDKVPSPPTSAEYLSSLSGAKATAGAAAANANVGASAAVPTAKSSPPPPADADAASRESQRSSRSPQSVFEALDSEFGEFAKAMWGEDVLRFPTQEEMAERAEAAREARAKRVTAIRRATMATNVSEMEDGSYLVKVALPEGTTRDDVTLTVTPGDALRVTFAAEGRRSLYKDVRLPKDALFSEISAKFEAEGEKEEDGGDEASSAAVKEEGVSGLEVAVGRAVPPQPKRVDIR